MDIKVLFFTEVFDYNVKYNQFRGLNLQQNWIIMAKFQATIFHYNRFFLHETPVRV